MPLKHLPRTLSIRASRGTAVVHCLRANRLTSAIEVEADTVVGRVIAHVPPFTTVDKVKAYLDKNADTIYRWYECVSADYAFRAGTSIPYFGEPHLLAVSPTGKSYLDGQTIYVGGHPQAFESNLVHYLKGALTDYVRPRVDYYARRLGVADRIRYVEVKDLDARRAWGCCYETGHIHFSWRLVGAPTLAIDTVACHEVAHINHPHHGPSFWEECERGMAGCKDNHGLLESDQWGMLLKRLKRARRPS